MHGTGKCIPWFRHRDLGNHGIVSRAIHSSVKKYEYDDGLHGGVATCVLHRYEEHVGDRMYTTLGSV
jgi:hypothetical protein